MTDVAEPGQFLVERRIVIDAPADAVYAQLIDFHNWTAWSPWEDVDPEMDRTYTGAESGVGARYAWKGNRKAGQGNMSIAQVRTDREVDIDLHFDKPFKANNKIAFRLDPEGGSTWVKWSMTGPKTLMSRVMGVVMSMDKLVGKDFEKGLAQLKDVVEG